jgi:Peptidase_G2, IMC autoproteolytic cleavage domain
MRNPQEGHKMAAPYEGDSTLASIAGLTGTNTAGGIGVKGTSDTYQGVYGFSTSNAGVAGESNQFNGIYGVSHDPHNAGVIGINDGNGWGVTGRSANVGVSGECQSSTGVGVHGKGGVLAGFFEGSVKVVGELYAEGPSAARFVGPLQVTGPTTLNGNVALNGTMTVQSGHDVIFADFAEHFEPVQGQTLEPGAVVVLTDTGQIQPCQSEYDTRVIGVISGAGNFRPAMILDRRPGDSEDEPPVALMGKVYCMADANDSPIRAGDLLTSSARPGHAMAAGDRTKRAGAIIGKALQPLATGAGLIPILVTLQ